MTLQQRVSRFSWLAGAVFLFSIFSPRTSTAVTLNIAGLKVFPNHTAGYQTTTPGDTPNFFCSATAPGGGSNGAPQFRCSTETQGTCTSGNPATNNEPLCGDISNDPQINYDSSYLARGDPGLGCVTVAAAGANTMTLAQGRGAGASFQQGRARFNYCNDSLFLCAILGISNELTVDVSLDEIIFEIFKFQDGSNPLDPGSTPPLRTFFIDNPNDGTMIISAKGTGVLPKASACQASAAPVGGRDTCNFCVLFDGNTNIQGELGKTNGQYGFRVTARTQIQDPNSGNLTITAVRAYPGNATRDSNNNFVSALPITIDVTNVHFVRSSATTVGQINPVLAPPYNVSYRLSKDALMTVNVNRFCAEGGPITACHPASPWTNFNAQFPPATGTIIRHVVANLPRVGEGTPGIPGNPIVNADSWNGRSDRGDFVPPGTYLMTLQAFSRDQFIDDLSIPTTRQVVLDPMQVTDLRVSPLTTAASAFATISYQLTEPSTVYVDIYPPNTQFCPTGGFDPLTNVNEPTFDNAALPQPTAKNFNARFTCGAGAQLAPIRSFMSQRLGRQVITEVWDGRDRDGRIVDDGDYVFVVYAALASQHGINYTGVGPTSVGPYIWSSVGKIGFVPINRGFVPISPVTSASTVLGSSPSAAGLDPFFFRYTMGRDAVVNLQVLSTTNSAFGQPPVVIKRLVTEEIQAGTFLHTSRWDGIDDYGFSVTSGSYMIQLTARDTFNSNRVSTMTAFFPVDLFRILDFSATPLLGDASAFATISYQVSQTMNVGINIYPPGSRVRTDRVWPPCVDSAPNPLNPGACQDIVNANNVAVAPVHTIIGLKPGRRSQTETWDGRNSNGLFVTDGVYPFTIVAQSTTPANRFASDKVIGNITVARGAIVFTSFSVEPDIPQLIFSSNTIELPPYQIQYSLNRQSSVTVQILTTNAAPTVIRDLANGEVDDAGVLITKVWDGKDNNQEFPPAGFYNVRVTAQDIASALSSGSTAQLTISYDPLRIYDLAIAPLRSDNTRASISYQVSETMKVSIKIYRPGTSFDGAGNPRPPESVSLVKRIVGIKPGRTPIVEEWDGTDLRQAIAPDGVYKFRLVGSTDIVGIDDLTGNVNAGTNLSLDQPIDVITVVRNPSTDPLADFVNNTFIYPNPITGPSAQFQIWVPLQSRVTMKIYNIAGELIYTKDFGEFPAATYVNGVGGLAWPKINQAGRPVGRGLYYAVFRTDETLGGRNVLQTVKKILIP